MPVARGWFIIPAINLLNAIKWQDWPVTWWLDGHQQCTWLANSEQYLRGWQTSEMVAGQQWTKWIGNTIGWYSPLQLQQRHSNPVYDSNWHRPDAWLVIQLWFYFKRNKSQVFDLCEYGSTRKYDFLFIKFLLHLVKSVYSLLIDLGFTSNQKSPTDFK